MATLLVIEDERHIVDVVRIALERDGHRVICARNGEDGLAEFARRAVALVILDIGLPGIDGLEVCRRIRAASRVPIIMLTARDEEADRVAGLELGADDYVPKPFSPRELAARVKAVLRRSEAAPQQTDELTLGDITLSRPRHEVHVGGRPVHLSVTEFRLLAFFMENPGLLFSREALLERVWDLEYPGGTRTVDQHVAQVRAKLGRADVIETIRGAGYKAVAR
ncbi:MAG: response regulator transcription factor [Thermoleophilia bacterium]|nr:response regulator transcription factor [Thermoleophilia bacterium]